MGTWGKAVESEFGSQQHWDCSDNTRKSENSVSASASSASLVLSPYFQQQPQLSHGIGTIIKTQKGNKRKSRSQGRPKLKPKVEAKVAVAAEEKVVSPYFQKNHHGEGGITTINSKKKVKAKGKAHDLNHKRVVSPYFPHEKNDGVVASKSNKKVCRRIQPQQEQSPSPLKKQGEDSALMNKKRLVSSYFPHGVNDIVVASKATLKNKKVKNDAYLRKSKDNAWVPPRSVHALIQEKYYEDPWKVLVICMLLNKTSGNQARKIIQDLFELCPNAEAATMVEIKELEKVIRSLGLQNKRSEKIRKLSEHYLSDDWTHVDDLPEIGKYAADAYAIFCTGRWRDVVPNDRKLVLYWKDLWKSEKTGNCCKDKSMDSGSP